jgi:hypothetical protein
MNRLHVFLAAAILIGVHQSSASAQVGVPFFGGGAIAFDPEISIVNSGALLDAQAVVSHDRKYVTITAQPSNSQLIALQTFAVGSQSGGFVGGPPVAPAPNQPQPNPAPGNVIQNSPSAIGNSATPSIVQQRGMTLLKPLGQ